MAIKVTVTEEKKQGELALLGWFLLIIIPLSLFSQCIDGVKSCSEEKEIENAREEMLESCYDVLPSLEAVINDFQKEIDLWKSTKEKFKKYKKASVSTSASKLASEKIAIVDERLEDLEKSYFGILEQAEMIAIENLDVFTELDKIKLQNLEKTARIKVNEASALRVAFSNSSQNVRQTKPILPNRSIGSDKVKSPKILHNSSSTKSSNAVGKQTISRDREKEEEANYKNGKRAVQYEFKIINGGVGYDPKTTSVFVVTADEALTYSKPNSNLNLYGMAAHSIADVKVSEGRIVAITQSHESAEQTLGETSFSEISNLRDALANGSKKVVIFGEGTGATAKASVVSQKPKKTASQTSGSNANTLPLRYEFKVINGGVGYDPKTTSVFVVTADEALTYSKPNSNLNLYGMAADSFADVKVSEGRIVAITQSHEFAERTLREITPSEVTGLQDALSNGSKRVVIFGEGSGATAKVSLVENTESLLAKEEATIFTKNKYGLGDYSKTWGTYTGNYSKTLELKIAAIGPIERLLVSDDGKTPKIYHEFRNIQTGWQKSIPFSESFRCYSSKLEHIRFAIDDGLEKWG